MSSPSAKKYKPGWYKVHLRGMDCPVIARCDNGPAVCLRAIGPRIMDVKGNICMPAVLGKRSWRAGTLVDTEETLSI